MKVNRLLSVCVFTAASSLAAIPAAAEEDAAVEGLHKKSKTVTLDNGNTLQVGRAKHVSEDGTIRAGRGFRVTDPDGDVLRRGSDRVRKDSDGDVTRVSRRARIDEEGNVRQARRRAQADNDGNKRVQRQRRIHNAESGVTRTRSVARNNNGQRKAVRRVRKR